MREKYKDLPVPEAKQKIEAELRGENPQKGQEQVKNETRAEQPLTPEQQQIKDLQAEVAQLRSSVAELTKVVQEVITENPNISAEKKKHWLELLLAILAIILSGTSEGINGK